MEETNDYGVTMSQLCLLKKKGREVFAYHCRFAQLQNVLQVEKYGVFKCFKLQLH
jgi:hypothetical protein